MITLTIIGSILLLLSIWVWYKELKLNKDIADPWLYLSGYYIAGCLAAFICVFIEYALKYLP